MRKYWVLGQAAKSVKKQVNCFQESLHRKILINPFRNNLALKITISNSCVLDNVGH